MRNFNNSYKILTGVLALVLVAGMTSPAFAQERPLPIIPEIDAEPLTLPEPPENLVYQNGNAPGHFALSFIDDRYVADDFVLEQSTDLTDAHFTWFGDGVGSNIEPLIYYILTDEGGQPGTRIGVGFAQNVETFELEANHFETWFDLQTPVPLNGGETYWFALKYTTDFEIIIPEPNWEGADVITGYEAVRSNPTEVVDIEIAEWTPLGNDVWFQLTGSPLDKPIGGTVGSMDTATLLVAGAQANMGLWSLALIGIVGAAAAITYKLKSKKTEQ